MWRNLCHMSRTWAFEDEEVLFRSLGTSSEAWEIDVTHLGHPAISAPSLASLAAQHGGSLPGSLPGPSTPLTDASNLAVRKYKLLKPNLSQHRDVLETMSTRSSANPRGWGRRKVAN